MRAEHRTVGPRWTRRQVLGTVGGVLGASVAGTAGSSADSADYWTVVALPDTQRYAENRSTAPREQAEWIAENADAENIVFVSHEGDLVEDGSDEGEWQHMDEALAPLDGTVPYSTVPGNHDWARTFDRSSSVANYKSYFGPSRYEGRSWFGGAGPSNGEPNRDDLNTYQLFSAGDYSFLHLALEWEAPGDVDDPSTPLGWAQQVLDEHADRPTILTTHSYLRDDTGRRTRSVQEVDGDGNTGQRIWETLVEPNPQVFMVFCGHWHETDGEAYQVSTNSAGEPVYELLADYQDRENGGNGLLRRVEFRPGGTNEPDRIEVRTFSPVTDTFERDDDSEFRFELDFDERFGAFDEETERTTFEQGASGYAGTVDTALREAAPDETLETAETVTIDSNDPQGSGNESQYLVRFDGVFGLDDGTVPPDSDIRQATLTVQSVDGGDGSTIHRMLADWDPAETWASFDGGVQTDGSEAVETPVATTGPVGEGPVTVDITETVQSWADGQRNRGWVFAPAGGDGWDIRTAESDAPPRLRVWYVPPSWTFGDADGDGDVDDDDVRRMQRAIANDDVDIDREAADVDNDGDVDIGDAVIVQDMTGGDT